MIQRVVFVTPVFPSFTGNGLAMRSAAVLKLLSRWAKVDLLVIPIYNARSTEPDSEVVKLCQSWKTVPNPDWNNFDLRSQDCRRRKEYTERMEMVQFALAPEDQEGDS